MLQYKAILQKFHDINQNEVIVCQEISTSLNIVAQMTVFCAYDVEKKKLQTLSPLNIESPSYTSLLPFLLWEEQMQTVTEESVWIPVMDVQVKLLISGFPSFIPMDTVSPPSDMLAAAPIRKGNTKPHTHSWLTQAS